MKEIYSCPNFKVLNVHLATGEKLPLHNASSDAFIICKKGKGRIKFADRSVTIAEDETLLIQANEPHELEVLVDFASSIILETRAQIQFIKNSGAVRGEA